MDSPFFLFNKGDKVKNPSYSGVFTFIEYTTETRQFSRVKDYTGLERIFYSSDLQGVKNADERMGKGA